MAPTQYGKYLNRMMLEIDVENLEKVLHFTKMYIQY